MSILSHLLQHAVYRKAHIVAARKAGQYQRPVHRQRDQHMRHVVARHLPAARAHAHRRSVYQRVGLDTVLYLERSLHKMLVHTTDGDLETTQSPQTLLTGDVADEFIRCHQSYLINVQYIRGIETDGFLMIDDVFVPISQKKYWASKRRYVQYIQNQG